MGFTDFFRRKKKQEPAFDPLTDLVLSKLKPGYLLDYDLKSWIVKRYNVYDWGDGMITEEWEIKSGNETCYLDREEDDEVELTLSRRLPFKKLDPDGSIARAITKNDDPPGELSYEGKSYYLEESGGGYFQRDGKGIGTEFLTWNFEAESGEEFISIEQWGENDFSASIGIYVEEYQFSNILPSANPT